MEGGMVGVGVEMGMGWGWGWGWGWGKGGERRGGSSVPLFVEQGEVRRALQGVLRVALLDDEAQLLEHLLGARGLLEAD